MAKTVIGLVGRADEAQKAIDELLKSGFDRKDIGVISSDLLREAGAAMAGATKGMTLGGLAGALLAATAFIIPGIGPVVAAGPGLALMAGTAAGAIAGGLIGAMTERGVPEDDAHFYAEGVRRGGTLITVNAKTDELAARAVDVLKRHGARDVDERSAEWKQQGWNGRFDSERQVPMQTPAQREAQAGRAAADNAPTSAEAAAQPIGAASTGAAMAGATTPATQAPEQSAGARGKAVRSEQEWEHAEREFPVGAVAVYTVAIEMPADTALASSEAATEKRPTYRGPERRARSQAYGGADRRLTA
jgi:hypothetical protein